MQKDANTILKQHKVSITPARIAMLKIFQQSEYPLPQHYFLKQPSLGLNRITIFRTLKIFTQKKIVYAVPSTDGVKRYTIKRQHTGAEGQLVCSICHKIIPLKEQPMPGFNFPADWTIHAIKIEVQGICKSCRTGRQV